MLEGNLQIITTKDGSHSIYNTALNETYHSVGGAIEESEFIYIDKGLRALPKLEVINLLEIGFGTGLNAILTLAEVINEDLSVDYTTLEPFPLTEEIVKELNYPSLLDNPTLGESFNLLHTCPWEERVALLPGFRFQKQKNTVEDFKSNNYFDLVYYDAFAPSKQADIWDVNNLKKVKGLMTKGAILVTYCSNGKFKRDLREVGFRVESLPGPLGKREITRAWV